jgi:NAD(P)-dependent dehydrogenase (short-subunit alcohol dehydrogenase family)
MGLMLEGKTAIVTGGAGGIGRYLCEGLAREGAKVVIADIIDATDAIEMTRKAGGEVLSVECDLSNEASIKAMVKATEDRFGGCDVLVHCAAYQPHTPFAEVGFESWRRTQSVNVDSLYHMGQAILPGMKERGWGRVINFTSTTFYDATPHHSEYVTSKAALIGFTRILAKEYGPYGITVNCLAPGLVRTHTSADAVKILLEAGFPDYYEIIKGQQCIPRTLVPEDMVGPTLFLASDASRAVTGQCLLADGGWQHV